MTITARFSLGLLLAALAALPLDAATSAAPKADEMRWVYLSHNFMFAKNVDTSIEMLTRAAKAGYNGVALTDCKFARWFETVTVRRPEYDQNLKRLRQACRDLKMGCYVFAGDQGTDLLANDPNLAEGMPVVDAPFVVRGGALVPADSTAPTNLSFEESTRAHEPTGWNVDDPGTVCFLDDAVSSAGKRSVRIEAGPGKNAHGNGRIFQVLKVEPFRYYHLSAMVKTDGFGHTNTFTFWVGKPGQQTLNHQSWDIQETQDWKRFDVVFNTLDNTEVNVFIGSWGGQKGKLWIDDLRFEPGGFVNLLRRDGCPFSVVSTDGKTTYKEGADFADAKDPKMGNTQWPGLYAYWYEQPVVKVPSGSRLKEGDRVKIGYSHAMICLGYGVSACMNEPKIWPLIERNLAEMHQVLEPDGYILCHDEIRQGGWDHSCAASGRTPLQSLRDNVKTCVALITKEDPGKPIFAWNDMFDPYHNASKHDAYDYLVKGKDPFHGSWEALDPAITILNWHGHPEKRAESLKFFADRGHQQILCGFYDSTSDNMIPWMQEAQGLKGIVGAMYTTWGLNYDELEKFQQVVDAAKK